MSNAAATAKRWGLNAIQRQTDRNGGSINGRKLSDPPVDLNQPMGRGQPLPPPGTPLPGPGKKSAPMAIMPKRKPVAPPPGLPRRSTGNLSDTKVERRPVPPPPLPTRRRRVSQIHNTPGNEGASSTEDNVLIVEAPTADSEPNSPSIQVLEHEHETENDYDESSPAYIQPWVEDAEELDAETETNTDEGSDEMVETVVSGGDEHGEDEEKENLAPTPPELPPRKTAERQGEDPQHQEQAVNGADEDEEEDGFSNWVDNPGFDSSENADDLNAHVHTDANTTAVK